MTERSIGTIVALMLVQAACLMPGPSRSLVPSSATPFVCRPDFETREGPLSAGTAFVAQVGRDTVLVTAHHLFGPDGGVAEQVRWDQLPAFVRSVKCRPLAGDRAVSAGAPLRVADARPYSEKGDALDVAVFRIDEPGKPGLPVCREAVRLGSPVWLVARVAAGAPESALLHRAVLVDADAAWIAFQYDNSELVLTATSGAPIVDASGCVVGINIGVGARGGNLLGIGQSALVVARAVERALAEAPSQRK